MAFPSGLTLVTVHCRFDNAPAGGAVGTVRFAAPAPLRGGTDNSIVPAPRATVDLAADGTASIQLPATNDPDWTPQGWAYAVTATVGATTVRGTLQLDYQTAAVELADLLQIDGSVTPGVTYATLTQLAGKLDTTGGTLTGPLLFGADVNLYRAGANQLATDDAFTAAGTVTAPSATIGGTSFAAVAGGTYRATDHGLVGWTFDPAFVQSGTVMPTAGLAHVARVQALGPAVTNILFHFPTAGSGLTAGQCFAALYNDAGALLGAGAVTADQSANWATGGLKTCPLTVAQGVTPFAWYRVLWWFNGTTGPTLSRAVNSSSAILNAGLAAPNFRFSTANAALTNAASAPSNMGTQTGGPTAWWVGLS